MADKDTADGDGCQAGACCQPQSESQIAQEHARQLMHQAFAIVESKKDIDDAEVMIRAAYVLLDRTGGRHNEPGVWLLAAQGVQAQAKGYPVHALEYLRQCKDKAVAVFGPDDINTLVCQGNYASTLAEMGLFQGQGLLRLAIERLKKAIPTERAPQEFIDRAIADCEKAFGEAIRWQTPEEMLAQFKRIYIHDGFTTGIMDAQLRDGNPTKVDVWYRSFADFEKIPDEHKVKFKDLHLVWGQYIPPGVVLQ